MTEPTIKPVTDATPKKTERKAHAKMSQKDVLESSNSDAKLDWIISNGVKKEDLDALTKRIDSIEASIQAGDLGGTVNIEIEDLEKSIEDFLASDRKEDKKKVASSARKVCRADENILWRGLHWIDEKTRGWASALAVTGGCAAGAYQGGKAGVRGVKAAVNLVRGDPAAAVAAVVE